MKLFTPELIARLDSPDLAVANAAEAEWEERTELYEQRLQQLLTDVPERIRYFDSVLLHDADVLSLARQDDKLLLVMRKDIPPRNLVILTYTLASEPVLDREALPPEDRCGVMQFMYNEFDAVREGAEMIYTESILFSNGWELQLRFRDVQVVEADPLYVVNGFPGVTPAAPLVSRSA